MIEATALLQKLQDCEAELAELQKKAEFHQQQAVGHNNELRACQNNMIHVAGKRDAIKEILAPAQTSESAPTLATESSASPTPVPETSLGQQRRRRR